MPYKCIEKSRECNRRWYNNHKEKQVRRVQKRKNELWFWFSEYKKKFKCARCGENHPACLDFHHIKKQNKDNWVSTLVNWGYSKEKIEQEIKKCIPLCANCHRKLHSETNMRDTS